MPAAPLATPRVAAVQYGASDRTADAAAKRAFLAKFDLVMWGIWEGRSSALNASMAAIRAIHPSIRFGLYSIVTELQNAHIDSITRVGNLVTVTTPRGARGQVTTGSAGRIVIASSPVAAYNGTWTLERVQPNAMQFRLPSGVTPPDDFSGRAAYARGNDANLPRWRKAHEMDAWLHTASGGYAQWTSSYGADDLNVTAWGTRDAAGRSWPVWRAQYDRDTFFGPSSAYLDYAYTDNTFATVRTRGDYRRNGVDADKTDDAVNTAHRKGMLTYWDELQRLMPKIRIIGNTDNDLASPEYRGRLDGGFIEGAIGASYSVDSYDKINGFQRAMDEFAEICHNVREPAAVIFNGHGKTERAYETMRLGLAAMLMRDCGSFSFSGPVYDATVWHDEFDAPLGRAIDPEQDGPRTGPVWWRRYEGGLVIVNPSYTASQPVPIGAGYRRLSGVNDPVVNDGSAVPATITMPPRTAYVLVKS